MSLRRLPTSERSLAQALALGPVLASAARMHGSPWIAASVCRGPAICLGALQRAGRVADLTACGGRGVAVLRRATTGTAAFVSGSAILWTLALPHVAAIAPDATARTLLNRNVRGFLRGLERAGATGRYFGREWIAVQRSPAALLGYAVAPDGVVLVDVLAAWDGSFAVPRDLAAAEERAVDRYPRNAPVPLRVALGASDPLVVADAVIAGVAERAALPLDVAALEAPEPVAAIVAPGDPIPDDLAIGPCARVPIGWIDVAASRSSGRVWIGGDVLVATSVLRATELAAFGEDEPEDAGALDGARPEDLTRAARAALDRAT